MDLLTISQLGKTLVALVFVCALAIVVLRWLAPRILAARGDESVVKRGSRTLRVVERLALDRETQLVLVSREGSGEILLAIGKHGVTTITVYDSERVPHSSEFSASQLELKKVQGGG